jgi:hypothetical protein
VTRKTIGLAIVWAVIWFGAGATMAAPERQVPPPQPTPQVIYVTPAPQPTPTPEVRISYSTPPECLLAIVDMKDRYRRALNVIVALTNGEYDDPAIEEFITKDTPESVDSLAAMVDRCIRN